MKDTSAARRYAKALFEQAMARKELRACQQGLEEVVRVARLKKSVVQGLSHPFISLDQKQQAMKSVLGEYSTPLLERFFLLLVERRRFDLVFAIEQEFQVLVNRHEKIELVRITSAFPLSAAQQKTISQALEKWLHATIKIDAQVDTSLIGGYVVKTRDHILDHSLKGQLQRLKNALAA